MKPNGKSELKKFLALFALSNLVIGTKDTLLIQSLVRAKFCEQLAATFGPTDSYTVAFMADLFSMIDGLLEIPMEQILQQLPLQPCITDALVHQRGERATYLKTINAYEQTD